MNTETENTGRNNTHTQEPARPRKVAPKTAAESGSRPVQPRKPKAPDATGPAKTVPPGAAASLIIVLLMLLVQGAWGAQTTNPATPISISGASPAAPGWMTNFLTVSKGGSDASGRRASLSYPFRTIRAAESNAMAGDTVMVMPGTYVEHDLLKKGINLAFYPHSCALQWFASTNTLADGKCFFDERSVSGGTTNAIMGWPNCYFSAGTNVESGTGNQGNTNAVSGVLLVTNVNTQLTMDLGVVDGDFFLNADPALVNGAALNPALFNVINSRRTLVYCDDLRNSLRDYVTLESTSQAGSGFYWEAGETYFTVKHIDPWATDLYAIWANNTSTNQHNDNFWVNVPGQSQGKIYVSVVSTNIRCWFNGQEFKTTNSTDNPFNLIGGKTYIVADKISSAAGTPIVYTGLSNSAVWVTAQKITAPSGGQWFQASGSGDIYLHAMQYEVASGSLAAAGGFQFTPSGNCPMHAVIEGGEALADGLGVNWAPSSGYVNTSYLKVKNLGLNTALADHAGNFSISVNTNGVAVIGSRFRIPASCTNSIVAPLAQPQTVETYWSAANVTTNGAITFTPNAGWTVNAAVK